MREETSAAKIAPASREAAGTAPGLSRTAEKVEWYARRLLSMSPAEVVHRVGEHARRRLSRRREWSWDDFACGDGPLPSLPRPRHLDVLSSDDVTVLREQAGSVLRRGPLILGKSGPLPTDPLRWHRDPLSGRLWPREAYCFDISYRHEANLGDVKYVWELNRLQHLQPVAILSGITGDRALLKGCLAEIESWIDANPPFKGVNWASGIELSLRVVSILVVLAFADEDADLTAEQRRKLRACLAAHGYWLARYPSLHSSANNHLIAEAAGLFLLGMLAPDLPGAERFAAEGRRILEQEIDRQILADGVGAEQSPTYTCFTIEWYLLAILVADEAGAPLSARLRPHLARAGVPLRTMMDESGEVPRIGDDDEGRVLLAVAGHEEGYVASVLGGLSAYLGTAETAPPAAKADLRSVFFGKPTEGAHPPAGWRTFDKGGYTVVRERVQSRDVLLAFDHGPLGFLSIAAHGHADTLAIWLHVDGQPVLVDAGTYLYGSGGAWRDYFRSTAAHNTLTLNATSSSRPAGPFNWRHKAKAVLKDATDRTVVAEHDGYRRAFGVVHERRIARDGAGFIVEDRLKGTRPETLRPECTLLVHPSLGLEREVSTSILIRRDGEAIVRISAGEGLDVRIARGETAPPRGWYAPRFGEKVPADQIILSPSGSSMPDVLSTRIEIIGRSRDRT